MTKTYYNRFEINTEFLNEFLEMMSSNQQEIDFNKITKCPRPIADNYDINDEYVLDSLQMLWKYFTWQMKQGKNPTKNAIKRAKVLEAYIDASDRETFNEDFDINKFSKSERQLHLIKGKEIYVSFKVNGNVSKEKWEINNWGCPSNAEDVIIKKNKKTTYIYFKTENGLPLYVFKKLMDIFPHDIGWSFFDNNRASFITYEDTGEGFYTIKVTPVDKKEKQFEMLSKQFKRIYSDMKI